MLLVSWKGGVRKALEDDACVVIGMMVKHSVFL